MVGFSQCTACTSPRSHNLLRPGKSLAVAKNLHQPVYVPLLTSAGKFILGCFLKYFLLGVSWRIKKKNHHLHLQATIFQKWKGILGAPSSFPSSRQEDKEVTSDWLFTSQHRFSRESNALKESTQRIVVIREILSPILSSWNEHLHNC